MRSMFLLALFPFAAIAALNGHCSGTATDVFLEDGICIHTGTCVADGGAYMIGGCPNDVDDVKCCLIGTGPTAATNPCGGYSWCEWTSNSCDGVFETGHCPGGSDYKCCLFH